MDRLFATDDLRIEGLRPLIPPAILMEQLPITPPCSETVAEARAAVGKALRGEDDRLVVVAGPCSIHDTAAALEYAGRLRDVTEKLNGQLVVIMRVYFEKPRTTVGWKGLINDPYIDGSFKINDGLQKARRLLLDLGEMGLPAGSEFLDTIIPQFIADLVSWGAIGARTTESQVHRELASGLSMPVGFKNGTSGNTQIALDAVAAAHHPHHFLSVTKQGISAIVSTKGNDDCHLILRGGERTGPNFSSDAIAEQAAVLKKNNLIPRLMIDCSHANCNKDHRKQPAVARNLAAQIAGGSANIFGVMLESHLVAGRQDLKTGRETTYGQSITDACIGWEETATLLESARGGGGKATRFLKSLLQPARAGLPGCSTWRVIFGESFSCGRKTPCCRSVRTRRSVFKAVGLAAHRPDRSRRPCATSRRPQFSTLGTNTVRMANISPLARYFLSSYPRVPSSPHP